MLNAQRELEASPARSKSNRNRRYLNTKLHTHGLLGKVSFSELSPDSGKSGAEQRF